MVNSYKSNYTGEDIDNAITKVSTHDTRITATERDITNIETRVGVVENNIKTTNDKVNNIETRVDAAEDNIERIITEGVGVGRKADEGGEIFNDYENNEALAPYAQASGYNTVAGCLGYYIYSVDFGTKVITLTKEQLTEPSETFEVGYEVGDIVSLNNGSRYTNCAKITAINGNRITVSNIPFTSVIGIYDDVEADEWGFYVLDKPAVGEVSLGYYTHAEGQGNHAVGISAHAEGVGTIAIGHATHAEGYGTTADGGYSHSEGFKTIAKATMSHAEGYKAAANNVYSHAEGSSTQANGSSAHAEGGNTKANGQFSHAEGNDSVAKGTSSHAEGTYTKSNAHSSHAEGRDTEADGDYSHAEGRGSKAVGKESHAEGSGSRANGSASHAEGYSATANGAYSHAEGSSTCADGSSSHAEGDFSQANGKASHAEGGAVIVNGMYSHGEGFENTVHENAVHSHVEGRGNNVYRAGAHVEGSFSLNDTEGKYRHILGGGTSDTNRKNLHTIDTSGNAWFAGNITIGVDGKKLSTEEYVDDNIKHIKDDYYDMHNRVDSINMQLETLGMNVAENGGAIAENGGAISNLTDRMLNVETNKADFNYVSQFFDSFRNESEFKGNKGVPNGYAPLDEKGKIPVEYLYNNDNPETVTYTTYGVSIDLSNSNPETSVTYTDDAVGMSGGSSAWYKMSIFNKIKPCLFKDGKVVGYLNPDNFTQFSDGSDADITSGDAGDVMIEIPKIGYRILKNGTSLSVYITDEPNREGFSYKAHTRTIEGDRDKLYVGAFLGSVTNSKLYSLSGKIPHYNEKIYVMGGRANSKGLGYDILSYYPLMLLQCLYLIMYKNLNSQTALGRGYVNGSTVKNTGATIDKGMNYGTPDSTEQMKFLGIEDFWGNLNQFIYGCYIDDNAHLLVATDSFNLQATGYTDIGEISPYSTGGYMSEPQGNNNAGFMVRYVRGSSSTYFSDYALVEKNRIPVFGGCYVHGDAAGVFRINMIDPTNDGIYFGARLMFL